MVGTAFTQGWLMMAGLIVAIGAQNALVLRQGLARLHVGPVVAVCAASDAALVLAGVFGLGALVQGSPLMLEVLRYGGAAFLVWCGARAAWRAWAGGARLQQAGVAQRLPATLATVAALTWLNPHVYLDTVVLVGAVGAQQPPDARLSFAFGAGLASTMWFATIGYGAAALAPVLAKPRTWQFIEASVALVMWAVAAQLLWKGVSS